MSVPHRWSTALKSLLLSLALLASAVVHGQQPPWTEATLPDPNLGESAINWVAFEQRGEVRSARAEVIRADHFGAEWIGEIAIHVRGSQAGGTRQIRLIRSDQACRADAARRRTTAENYCDNLLISGTDANLQVRYLSADANTSFAFALRRSPTEPMVWRNPSRGLRFEPAIAVRLQRDAAGLRSEWRVDGDHFSHRNRLAVPPELQRALVLSDAEAGLLGLVDLAYAVADFEGPEPIPMEAEAVAAQRSEVDRDPGTLRSPETWPGCTGGQCTPPSEGECADFQCGVCELRPRGVTSEQCHATLYGAIGQEAPDISCFFFICWNNSPGSGGTSGGSGGGSGGSGGGAVAPAPNCVRYHGPSASWYEEPAALPDFELDLSARKRKPIASYIRSSERIAISNVNVDNQSCGTFGLQPGINGESGTIFFNELRVYYDRLAWSSFNAFFADWDETSGIFGGGKCASMSAMLNDFTSNVSGMALGSFTLSHSYIGNAVCAGELPYLNDPGPNPDYFANYYPMSHDWRVWVKVVVDPAGAVGEVDESNNHGYTRNWVKLRRP